MPARVPATRTVWAAGAAGRIEVLLDEPVGVPRGVGIVAHPQPLLGASARHKVPHVLAHALRDQGWLALRPNFRGVGASEGVHDHGSGEADDLVGLARQARRDHPGLPLALMGFSFGAYVQSHVAARLAAGGEPARHVLLAGMPVGQVRGWRDYDPAPVEHAWLVHGELDDRASLQELLGPILLYGTEQGWEHLDSRPLSDEEYEQVVEALPGIVAELARYFGEQD